MKVSILTLVGGGLAGLANATTTSISTALVSPLKPDILGAPGDIVVSPSVTNFHHAIPTTMVTSTTSITSGLGASKRDAALGDTCDPPGSTCNPGKRNNCCSCHCVYGWTIGYICGGGNACGQSDELIEPKPMSPHFASHNTSAITGTSMTSLPKVPVPGPIHPTVTPTVQARDDDSIPSTHCNDGPCPRPDTPPGIPPVPYCNGGPCLHGGVPPTVQARDDDFVPLTYCNGGPCPHPDMPPPVQAREDGFYPLPYCNNGPCPHPTSTPPA